jgi:hypothetical protein
MFLRGSDKPPDPEVLPPKKGMYLSSGRRATRDEVKMVRASSRAVLEEEGG